MSRDYLMEVLVREYGFSADLVYDSSYFNGPTSDYEDLEDQSYTDWDDAA